MAVTWDIEVRELPTYSTFLSSIPFYLISQYNPSTKMVKCYRNCVPPETQPIFTYAEGTVKDHKWRILPQKELDTLDDVE
jgi:hypothetical protein